MYSELQYLGISFFRGGALPAIFFEVFYRNIFSESGQKYVMCTSFEVYSKHPPWKDGCFEYTHHILDPTQKNIWEKHSQKTASKAPPQKKIPHLYFIFADDKTRRYVTYSIYACS